MKRLVLAVFLCAAAPVAAQMGYPAVKTDVQSILAAPDNGQRVILHGKIVGRMGKEEYLFSDGTGQIRVEIEDRILWGQVITGGARLEIEGEVDEHLFSDEVDIDVARVLVLKGAANAGGN